MELAMLFTSPVVGLVHARFMGAKIVKGEDKMV
jgi:hypothetical protein